MSELFYQIETTNKSFLDMHKLLKSEGVDNNKFFLVILDPLLCAVNPFDPNLSFEMKHRVVRECFCNYWYFLREVVRVPVNDIEREPFRLDKASLAINYCMMNNFNTIVETPTTQDETTSVLSRLLWEFLIGTKNSEFAFINRSLEDSNLNLSKLKMFRKCLPEYLQMDSKVNAMGKKIKFVDNYERLENPGNMNRITTKPSARSEEIAESIQRGLTQNRQWFDNATFIPYMDILLSQKSIDTKNTEIFKEAIKNQAPYGIIATTTSGDLNEKSQKYVHELLIFATKFNEYWYDKSLEDLKNIINSTSDNSFVYIKYSYKDLGHSEEWYNKRCQEYQNDWNAIRKEILLEWVGEKDE